MREIQLAGLTWQVVDEDKGLICTKDVIHRMEFGENNDWTTSGVRKWLNEEFLQRFTDDEKNMIEGEARLLTLDEVKIIDIGDRIKTYENKKSSWWTSTPYPSDSYAIRYVYVDGSVCNDYAYNGLVGVAPALNLKSEYFKSVKNLETDYTQIIQSILDENKSLRADNMRLKTIINNISGLIGGVE